VTNGPVCALIPAVAPGSISTRIGRLGAPLLRRRRHLPIPLVPDNAAEILCDGAAYFDEIEKAVESAQHYILVGTYILRADNTGWRVCRLLAKKRAEGVEVALTYDGYGSFGLSSELLEFLRLAGVKVLEYRPVSFVTGSMPWTQRNHRKMIIVDGRVGITGGHNIADDYASVEQGGKNWRDTGCRLEGPAVHQLEDLFRRNWGINRGDRLESRPIIAPPVPGGVAARFVGNFARRQRAEIRRDYLAAILGAQKTVRVTNAYFAPDRGILRALLRASRNGVTVELILAGLTDVKPMLMVTHGLYGLLLKNGVKIYEWHERILHAKTAVVDGIWSSIGSANLNQRSFRFDLEANVTIVSARFGEQMDEMFEVDRGKCRAIDPVEWKKRPRWMRMLEWFFGLFRRIV